MECEESSEDQCSWRGCSMDEIYRNLNKWELRHAAAIQPSNNHTVLYHCPRRNLQEPPKPLRKREKWDSSHVRLPCSSQNQYPVSKSDGTVSIECRWDLICASLTRTINNSRELEAAILSYNSKYSKVWKFRALHKLFEEESTEDEEKDFFRNLLPEIIALALRLPELISAPIPLLKQGQNRSISLSQQQISCLLSNAFLCTFPRRNTTKRKSEYSAFPAINFSRLFQSEGRQVIEKIKCICNYFRRVCNTAPIGVLTFTRRSLMEKETPKWEESNAPLGVTPLHVSSAGTIEDQGQGLLQVDFANKFIGGGVLGSGCVQEEIRFVICPELLVSKLFTEALKPYEALIMVGCEQYSKYTGYASTFTWGGDFVDMTPVDECGRKQCNIVAIDALHFVQSSQQYREEMILRELNKAYVGFIHTLDTPAPGVASGNWGCGAFGGEATLKALIQLMACTITKRPLVYFTFGNIELRNAIHNIHTFFIENNVTVKQLWSYLKEFQNHKLAPSDLYAFICQLHRDKLQSSKIKGSRSQILQEIADTNEATFNLVDGTSATKNLRQKPEQDIGVDNEQVLDERVNREVDAYPVEDRIEGANVSTELSSLSSCQEAKLDEKVLEEEAKSSISAEDNMSTKMEMQNGSRMRQRSLLEMLDCYYNKDTKRVRKS